MSAYNRKVEGLAEAIMKFSGYLDPSSDLHEARNPGGLKATSMRHLSTSQGHRVFNSFIDGVQALLFDLNTKLSGQSWAHLKPESNLKDLAISYALPAQTAAAWAKFLRAALKDDKIAAETTLDYFTKGR